MTLPLLTAYFLMQALILGCEATPTTVTTRNYTSLAKCLKVPSPSSASPGKILDHVILYQYFIVPPSGSPRASSSNPGSRRQATTTPGKKRCPFIWKTDSDSNRRPSTLLKAVCNPRNACGKCREITYGHQVLKFKCNAFWDWETVNLPVAFV